MLSCELIDVRLSDGYPGCVRLWMPSSVRGAVLYLHGIQSHGGWFEGSARRLAEAGWAVLMPDRRGSGRNELDRGHTPSARRLLIDGAEYLDALHVRTGLTRFGLVGVSWGGKLALALYRHAAARFDRIALVAPGLFPRVDLPIGQKVRVALTAVAARRTRFDIPLNDPALFTAHPDRQRFIEHDHLALRQVTTAFLLASRRLDRHARAAARGVPPCPLRCFLAGQDRIIDNERTAAFIRRLPWPEREITRYGDAHHALEFEPDPEPYFRDLAKFFGYDVQHRPTERV